MCKQFIRDIEPFFCQRAVLYVDVGAHRGNVYKLFKNSDLRIHEAHLIEPSQSSYTELKAAAETIPGNTKVSCHNLALGAVAGRVRMRYADTMTRVIEKIGEQNSNDQDTFEAECSTLDTLAQTFLHRHISILKIDVEGYEEEVLKGAEALLDDQAIHVIYIEAGLDPDNRQQCYYRKIEDYLLQHGYKIFKIYEQKNEWPVDSPLLRRANFAFMSRAFADRNPYMLSKELFDSRKAVEQLRRELAESSARMVAMEAELSRERRNSKEAREQAKRDLEERLARMAVVEAERSGERQDSSKALEQLRRELAESSARMVAMEAERSGERQDSSKALRAVTPGVGGVLRQNGGNGGRTVGRAAGFEQGS
jgi:FkbM family methyltransferase